MLDHAPAGRYSYMYDHYLSGLGSDYELDYEHLYDVDSSIQADVALEIAQAQKAAERLSLVAGSESCMMTSENRNVARGSGPVTIS